ncbi:MAG: hypothetical protein JSW64_04790 [Candidatus Zixiibacteriota bacterium]|nr:MAG: hypothetical protein JSW64_04790 [candidate division Zixibacteria bacterium]
MRNLISLLLVTLWSVPVLAGDFESRVSKCLKLANAHYFIVEAEDTESEHRFYYRDGCDNGDGTWAFEETWPEGGERLVLGGLIVSQESRNEALAMFPIDYHSVLGLDADCGDLSPDDTIAFLRVFSLGSDSVMKEQIFNFIITAGYIESSDNGEVRVRPYIIPENRKTLFELYSTGRAPLYVDYIKVFCDMGRSLLELGLYSHQFAQYAIWEYSRGGVSNLRFDIEPRFDHLLPVDYLVGLIELALKSYREGFDVARMPVYRYNIRNRMLILNRGYSAGEYSSVRNK